MRYLLTGSTGLLGSTFARVGEGTPVALPRDDVKDVGTQQFIERARSQRLEAIINCAADVNADGAESDPEPSYQANVELPARLAEVSRNLGIPIVHFSSTGVYGSWKADPYSEEDLIRPTTVHHTSKADGEDAVRGIAPNHLILRTGWLFGGTSSQRRNFVWQRLLEATKNATLISDQSQKGCPTWTDDIVRQTGALLRNNVRGTYNCVSQGVATRFEYVRAIVEIFELMCEVIPGDAFKRQAPVSPNETAINRRLQILGLDQMPHWMTSLRQYKEEVILWSEWGQLAKSGVMRP